METSLSKEELELDLSLEEIASIGAYLLSLYSPELTSKDS
jgi:hypothetical protein